MSHDIINNLKKLKDSEVSPDKTWVKENRELLLCQVRNTIQSEKNNFSVSKLWPAMTIFMPKRLVYSVVRPMAVLFLVFAVTASGWITTVDASSNALPGDWLYPAKRAVERTKITAASVVGAKQVEAKYRVEAAKNRAEEVKGIIKTTDQNKKNKLNQTITDLKNEIDEADKKLDEIQTDKGQTQTDEMVKEFKEGTAGIMTALKEAQDDLLGGSNEDKVLSKELDTAKGVVKDVEIKVVEVVLSKHLGGDETVTSEEVVEIIDKTLQNALEETQVSKKVVADMGLVIEEAKVVNQGLVDSLKNETGSTSTVIVKEGEINLSTTTLTGSVKIGEGDIGDKIAKIDSENQEATKQVGTASDNVTVKVDAVKSLLSVGSLEGVIEKMKEVGTAVKEVGSISDKSLANVTGILPVVKIVKEEVSNVVNVVEENSTSTTITTTSGMVKATSTE